MCVKLCDAKVIRSIDVNKQGSVIVDISKDNEIVGVEILNEEYKVEAAKRRTNTVDVLEDLIDICDRLTAQVANVRYTNWHTTEKGVELEGVELCASTLDELIIDADRAINRGKRACNKEKKTL